jgi:hypothetical protein
VIPSRIGYHGNRGVSSKNRARAEHLRIHVFGK